MHDDDTRLEPHDAARPDRRALALVDTVGSDAPTRDDAGRAASLADTRLSAPGLNADPASLADTLARDGDGAGVTDADASRDSLGLLRTLDSGARGPVARPDLSDPEERRRRQALMSRLFGDAVEAATIGRYRVLERLGAGGMGVVYAAYDDRLDRKVAIKVLRPDASGEAGKLRLTREAQAMARLSHPNIVGVHEVGEDGDSVFVAMEFVRGRSLDVWLEEPRAWRDVLGVFVQAGRGLEAAHAAGLVHRDFKPANAILGEDGRVKVLDFGLARAGAAALPEATDERAASMLEVRLTRTGATMGTPAYMSPEQHLGRQVTAASDQFSFFVALHEALYGALPFPGETLVALVSAVLERPPVEPLGADVPAWLRAVVRRGLEKDPARRFPDMTAALAALSRDPARRRVRVAAIAGLMLVSGAASAALVRTGAAEVGRCEHVADALTRAWTPERRTSARAAFVAASSELGASTWTLLEPRLTGFADAWTRVRGERCRALADGQLSEALHDRSVACLERQLARLDGLLDNFVAADPIAVQRAPLAVAALPAPSLCADAEFLLADVPPPEDHAARAAAARGRLALEQARASIDLGRLDAALARADAVADEARAVGYDPLLALAEVVRGDALQWRQDGPDADAALTAALEVGLASGDDRVAAEALARRVFVRAELLGRAEQARADLGVGRALLRRVHADPRLAWLLANNAAVADGRALDFDAAAAAHRDALRLADALPDAPEAAITRHNLGLLLLQQRRYDEARSMLADAADAAARAFGERHPLVGSFLTTACIAADLVGHLREADALCERARAVARGQPEPSPALELPVVEAQARIAFDRRTDDHPRLAAEALALAVAAFGPDHPRTAEVERSTLVDHPERDAERAAALRELAAESAPIWAEALLNHLTTLQRAGRSARVLERVAEARTLPAWAAIEPENRAEFTLYEAAAQLELGHDDDARRSLDALAAPGAAPLPAVQAARLAHLRGRLAARAGAPEQAALALRDASARYAALVDPDHPDLLDVRLDLARALRAAGQTAEADALAGELRATLRQLGPAFADARAELAAWAAPR